MSQVRSGIAGTASYAAARAASLIPGLYFHRYRLIAVPLPGMPVMPRGYEVAALSDAALAGRIDAGAEAVAYRRGQGLEALAALHKGEIMGVTWLTGGPFDEDEVRARWIPPAGMAWDTGMWVRPDRRLSRAFAALWAGTADWLRARGLTGSASRIADYNQVSLAPHARMGARTLGTATFAGAGPLQAASAGRPRITCTRSGFTVVETGRLS